MAELLTDDIIIEKLNEDGIMQEPDGPWLLEYIYENYGGQLDTTSDFVDDKWTLKIYSEMTYDGYDIFGVLMKINLMYHKMDTTMKIILIGL